MFTVTFAKALWLAGIVAWFVIRYPYQRRTARLGVARTVGGWQDRVLLYVAAAGQFVIPAVYVVTGFPAAADYPFHAAQGWLGLVVLVASLVLFRVTHRQLGMSWSVTLETRQDHRLVTEGVYAWVRHPMYSSFLIFAVAQALLLPNWVAGPAGLVGFGLLFFLRVPREEAMMAETFGRDYVAYAQRTARIVPWVY